MALNAVSELSYTDAEWKTEWQGIVDMSSINPRNTTATSYQSLEEVNSLIAVMCYLITLKNI